MLLYNSLNLQGRSFRLRRSKSFHFPPIRDTAVATGHSGNSSFVRISVTSVCSISHSFLSVQLQKSAYLFLNVQDSILSAGNERLRIKMEVLTMASYTKMTVGKENRTELHEKLALTGAEISLNTLPAGANVPFVHSHKANEEIYGVLSGSWRLAEDFSRGKTSVLCCKQF